MTQLKSQDILPFIKDLPDLPKREICLLYAHGYFKAFFYLNSLQIVFSSRYHLIKIINIFAIYLGKSIHVDIGIFLVLIYYFLIYYKYNYT